VLRQRTVVDEAGRVRSIRIDPWARSVHVFTLPTVALPCGCCWDVCGVALSDQLGRWQQARVVFGAEYLVIGVDVVAPMWRWGAIECRGLGLVLGVEGRTLTDSRMLPQDVESCITWPRRRAAARAA
jgi:hypothetical protein